MGGNAVAANVLGTIGTIFWCIQLVPQVIHNWKRKDCTGLPPLMMFLWSACGVPFSVYFICKDANIPIQVQPQLFTFFAGICWAQSLYYPPRDWTLKKTTIILVGTFIVFAGVECALIIPLRKIYQERGIEWPITLMGVLAAILLAAGLIPPYLELWKRKGQVVGINFIFLAIDTLGAIFSIFSLVSEGDGPDIDILGCVIYAVVLFLELGIFTSHITWMIRFRKERKLAKAKLTEEEENIETQTSAIENAEQPQQVDKQPQQVDIEESPK